MAALTTIALEPEVASAQPASSCEARWYAAYTAANREKIVAEQLALRSVESFLPLYETRRQWKDRRVTLRTPLFPGYVFLRMALPDRLPVLQIPGVARLVGFGGQPAALPPGEIERLREALSSPVLAEPHPFLRIGRRVRVSRGPFLGMDGILVRRKGRFRVVLSMELIMRSLIVDLDMADISPCS